MKTRFILLLSALLIFACALPGPSPTSAPTVVSEPTQTTVPPTLTAVIPTDTPTVASIFFRDDFNDALAGGWTWQNEDPANWSLSAERGWLQIMVGSGEITSSDYTNLFLRLAPSGDFQIETLLHFKPVADFQFAGLIIYQSDVDFLQAGRAYCAASDVCLGDGLYFDNFINSSWQAKNFATTYKQGDEVYLRLQRKGELYTFFASSDANNWTEIGQQRSGLEPLLIGLTAAQNTDGPIPARFDYFQVTGLQ